MLVVVIARFVFDIREEHQTEHAAGREADVLELHVLLAVGLGAGVFGTANLCGACVVLFLLGRTDEVDLVGRTGVRLDGDGAAHYFRESVSVARAEHDIWQEVFGVVFDDEPQIFRCNGVLVHLVEGILELFIEQFRCLHVVSFDRGCHTGQ